MIECLYGYFLLFHLIENPNPDTHTRRHTHRLKERNGGREGARGKHKDKWVGTMERGRAVKNWLQWLLTLVWSSIWGLEEHALDQGNEAVQKQRLSTDNSFFLGELSLCCSQDVSTHTPGTKLHYSDSTNQNIHPIHKLLSQRNMQSNVWPNSSAS